MTENLTRKMAEITGGATGIGRAVAANPSLGAFLPRFEEAISRFINDDLALETERLVARRRHENGLEISRAAVARVATSAENTGQRRGRGTRLSKRKETR